MSTKPGATTAPSASMVRSDRSVMLPISTTQPSLTPMSARYLGAPLPSTTVPPFTTRSSMRPLPTFGSGQFGPSPVDPAHVLVAVADGHPPWGDVIDGVKLVPGELNLERP